MIALALALATPAIATTPQPAATSTVIAPDHLAAARRLVDIVIPPAQRESMFQSMLNSMMGSMLSGIMDSNAKLREAFETVPEMKPIFAKFVERQRTLAMNDIRDNMPALIDAYAHAYARQFSVAELGSIEAFMNTDAGRKFVQRSAALLNDPDVREWMRKSAALSQKRMPEELRQLQEELLPIMRAHEAEKPRGS